MLEKFFGGSKMLEKELRTKVRESREAGITEEQICSIIVESLNDAIAKQKEFDSANQDNSLTKLVSNILREIGIPANLKGYNYLRESIIYCTNNTIDSITKELYPFIARKFNITPDRVERGMRHAIEVGCERADEEVMHEYFGNSYKKNKKKPTNSEFIFNIVDYIHNIH